MIDAILWDYDGTLCNSLEKNYNVMLEVLRRGVPRLYADLPEALKSLENFYDAVNHIDDWRVLYKTRYGMTDDEAEYAGSLWSQCQKAVRITPPLYDGIPEILRRYRNRWQGIVSQNSSDEIAAVLDRYGVGDCVGFVCGYDRVPYHAPKPSPVPFLKCVDALDLDPSSDRILFIGDHEEDVVFVENIRRHYLERGVHINLTSVAVNYSGSHPERWTHQPDCRASTVEELGEVLHRLDMGE